MDISAYQHPHTVHYTGSAAEKRTMRVVLLTVTMMVVEIVAGWVFNSMALFADGWHMGTHAAALGISWLAFVLARRYAADRRFAFGTWKIEVLGGFVSAILLGLVGLAMAVISIQRLLDPVTIRFDQAILVAVVGLIVNLLSIFLLQARPHGHDHHHAAGDHGHAHHGHPDGNLNLRAAYLHVIADAMTSVLAIVALLGGKYLGWHWLDPLIGIAGAILILRWTRSLLLDTGNILLDRENDEALAAGIRAAVETDAGTRVSDLHVWRVGQDKYACLIALVAAAPRPVEDYKRRLANVDGLVHVTVEVTAYGA
jgi:cation diffusion facilitator family transporter